MPLSTVTCFAANELAAFVSFTTPLPRLVRVSLATPPATLAATVSVEAPAGSILVMDGRVWHQSGVNRTPDHHRAALFGYYVRSWIRPQVNWNVFLDPDVAATLNPEFLDLLGYRTGHVDLLGGHQPPVGAGAGAQR